MGLLPADARGGRRSSIPAVGHASRRTRSVCVVAHPRRPSWPPGCRRRAAAAGADGRLRHGNAASAPRHVVRRVAGRPLRRRPPARCLLRRRLAARGEHWCAPDARAAQIAVRHARAYRAPTWWACPAATWLGAEPRLALGVLAGGAASGCSPWPLVLAFVPATDGDRSATWRTEARGAATTAGPADAARRRDRFRRHVRRLHLHRPDHHRGRRAARGWSPRSSCSSSGWAWSPAPGRGPDGRLAR